MRRSIIISSSGFGFRLRDRRSRGLPRKPLGLKPLAIVRKYLLRDLLLSHYLFGVDLAKCPTRFALGFGDRLRWLKFARHLHRFLAFQPASYSDR